MGSQADFVETPPRDRELASAMSAPSLLSPNSCRGACSERRFVAMADFNILQVAFSNLAAINLKGGQHAQNHCCIICHRRNISPDFRGGASSPTDAAYLP